MSESSPYAGLRLTGVVRSTWLRGVEICDESGLRGEPRGSLLPGGER